MEQAGFVVALIVLCIVCAIGVVLTLVRLPGTWLILFAALLFAWYAGWERVGFGVLGWLLGGAVFAEILETACSALVASRAGASRRGMIGGIVGGLVGVVFLSFLVPIPVIGQAIGALIGCFVGALFGELSNNAQMDRGVQVGIAAALGFVLGAMMKTAIALVMSVILIGAALSSRQVAKSTSKAEPTVRVVKFVPHRLA